jgi:type IV/VI secretion system ImpK/VasF family protein
MATQLAETIAPVIDHIQQLDRALQTGGDLAAVRSDIVQGLLVMEQEIQRQPGGQARFKTVKYVLASLADEVVLASGQADIGGWQGDLLEMELFNSSVAGERFFELLEAEGYRDPDLAELFFLAMVLGFQGKYRNKPEAVQKYKERCYALIPDRLPEEEKMIAPDACEVACEGHETVSPLFGLWTVVVVAVVAFGLYAVASQWMWADASEYINKLSDALPK